MKFKSICLSSLMFILFACGGGGGGASSSSGNSASATPTFIFTYQNQDQVSGLINYGVADLNGDGLEDIVISEWPGEGSGTVPSVPITGATNAFNKIPVKILLQQANGSLVDATSTLLGSNNLIYGTQRVVIQDFDNDGKPDIFLAGWQDSCCYDIKVPSVLFWNNGSSFSRLDFTEPVQSPGACTADLTGSGFQDIITSTLLYKNNGNRTFTTVSLSAPAGQPGSAACTVIKDPTTGYSGIVSGNTGPSGYNAAVFVYDTNLNYINTIGLPGFTGGPGTSDPNHFIPIDLNGDGVMDLLVTDNGTDNHNGSYHALINTGSFNFTDNTSTYFPTQTHDVTFAFSYRDFTYNGVTTIFVPVTDTYWNSNTEPGLLQFQNGHFNYWNPGTLQTAIGSYHYPMIYRTNSGLSLLEATVNGFLPNPQTNSFYYIPFY